MSGREGMPAKDVMRKIMDYPLFQTENSYIGSKGVSLQRIESIKEYTRNRIIKSIAGAFLG